LIPQPSSPSRLVGPPEPPRFAARRFPGIGGNPAFLLPWHRLRPIPVRPQTRSSSCGWRRDDPHRLLRPQARRPGRDQRHLRQHFPRPFPASNFAKRCRSWPAPPGISRLVRSFSHGSDDHFLSQAFALSGRRVPMTQITTSRTSGPSCPGCTGRAPASPYIAVPGTTRPGRRRSICLSAAGWAGNTPRSHGGRPRNEDFHRPRRRGHGGRIQTSRASPWRRK